jgi:hypothetical protein
VPKLAKNEGIAMTVVEWAEVALPLIALGWGMCLVAAQAETIDAWVAKASAWWTDRLRRP